jgi:hypothetical protein
MDVALRQKSIKYYTDEICIIPVQLQLQRYVNNIFRGYKLSKDQTSLICDWSEKVFPFVPMDAVKKILMTSIALSFLIKRLVQNGDKRLVLFMFHSVFKQTLVRRKFPRTTISWQKCMHDRDFLNAIFKN